MRELMVSVGVPLVWLALLIATPAHGQVRSMYSPGSTLTGGGTAPDPGFSYSNQFWLNTTDSLKGPQGHALPIEGALTVSSDTNTFVYVPKVRLMGALLEFTVGLSTTTDSFYLRDPLPGGPNLSGGGAGLTNTNVQPFNLGWQGDRIDFQTGYSFYVPTGRYDPGASGNTSSGFWSHSWQSGVTWYLTKDKATQISLYNAYLWNTTQQGTGIHPGQSDSLDYSLSQTVSLGQDSHWSLQIGAAGYGQWQTTENRGQNPIREALKYRVEGAGFLATVNIPFKGVFVSGSAIWEYAARNTFQGRTFTLTGGFSF